MRSDSDRRTFLGHALGLPALFVGGSSPAAAVRSAAQIKPGTLSVICVGGHPDDPESGCGGTLARYAEQGHRVTVIYLTRGERGISGKSENEAASIRTAEAEAACKAIGATAVFAGQIDGSTELNRARVDEMGKLIDQAAPDVVFTHWPIDTHFDHEVASLLTIRAYVGRQRRFPIFFFEVNAGSQTMGFSPTQYVDVTAVREKKKAALFAHKSQRGDEIYRQYHEVMESFRGREARVTAAEAFVQLPASRGWEKLPGT